MRREKKHARKGDGLSITHHGEAAGDGLEVLALAGALDVVRERGEERGGSPRVYAPAAVLLPGRQHPPRHHAAAAVRPQRAEPRLEHDLPGVTPPRRRRSRRRRPRLLRGQLADDRARRGRHGYPVTWQHHAADLTERIRLGSWNPPPACDCELPSGDRPPF
jgi:hypothetical protein